MAQPTEQDTQKKSVTSDGDIRALANALPAIIWTCNAEGRLDWVNDRWTELTGLGLAESLSHDGAGALAAIHPDDHGPIQRWFSQALDTGQTSDFEYRIRRRDGIYRYHLTRVAPIRDDGGVITRWVAASFDIHERHQAGEALRASERRFEAVFQLNPLPTTITRIADGTILLANDAFVRLGGYTRDEVIGSNAVALRLWTPEQRAAFVQTLREARGSIVLPARTKDGQVHMMQMASAPVDFGGERCMISVGADMSEALASDAMLRESEARARARADELAALMDALPATVMIASDPRAQEVRANRVGYELLRSEPGANLSKAARDSSPTRHFKVCVDGQEMQPADLPLQRAARGEEVRNHEEQILFDDGRVVHLYGSAVPLRDAAGLPRGSIAAFVDVTRLKQAEEALREADRRKDEFLSLLSHELRNPLAPIVTAAQLMQRSGDVETAFEREIILRQTRHLVRLVDDLLDVSRVARGLVTLDKQPHELAAIVGKAVEAVTPLVQERDHRLRVAVAPHGLPIDVDEVRLTQVVTNLLTNAARYTAPGGRIEVIGERQRGDIVLRVRDNGEGIDASLLPHIFDLFVQGRRGMDRSQGGLGLGLSLVRTLVALHGGSVTAHSDGPQRGSEFIVRLPVSATVVTVAPPVDTAPVPQDATRRPRVLVVDDNRDAAQLIGNLLISTGHDVRVAYDPSVALTTAITFRPEVAILDIGLPVMNGYDLARELRDRLRDDTPVLIALTGYGQEADRQRSQEAGFSAHLVKPVASDALLALLDTLTAKKH